MQTKSKTICRNLLFFISSHFQLKQLNSDKFISISINPLDPHHLPLLAKFIILKNFFYLNQHPKKNSFQIPAFFHHHQKPIAVLASEFPSHLSLSWHTISRHRTRRKIFNVPFGLYLFSTLSSPQPSDVCVFVRKELCQRVKIFIRNLERCPWRERKQKEKGR
jgi:hypothetical protein